MAEQTKRLWMPDVPNLREVLGLSDDPFIVTGSNLVRKAIDELTLGLHFYVLYTMTHSQARSGKGIEFRVRNGHYWDGHQGKYLPVNKDPKIYSVDLSNFVTYAQSVKLYTQTSLSKDVKQLLNHVTTLPINFRQCYYEPKPERDSYDAARYANILRKISRFYYHRNFLVPKTPEAGQESVKHDASNKREREMAAVVFYYCKCFVEHIPKFFVPKYDFKQITKYFSDDNFYNKNKSSLNTVKLETLCRNLEDASFTHFRNVAMICDIHKALLSKRTISTTDSFQKTLQDLSPYLEDSDVIQYVVFAIWTKFGPYIDKFNEYEREEKNTNLLDKFQKTQLSFPFRYAKVVRYTIKEDLLAKADVDNFLIKNKHFLMDPIGVTNLDMINRALDLTNQALKQILLKALTEEADNRDDQPEIARNLDDQRIARNAVLKSLMELNDNKIPRLEPSNDEVFNGIDATVFDRVDSEGKYLVKDFNEKWFCKERAYSQMLISERVRNFILYDPNFADPRFIGEFLNTLQFQDATRLINIRDDASHQRTLMTGRIITYQMLSDDIKYIRSFVESVATTLGVNQNNFKEFKALQELEELIGKTQVGSTAKSHYKRWRARQGFATWSDRAQKEQDGFWKNICEKTWKHLSEANWTPLTEPRIENSKILIKDHSLETLIFLLSMIPIPSKETTNLLSVCKQNRVKYNESCKVKHP